MDEGERFPAEGCAGTGRLSFTGYRYRCESTLCARWDLFPVFAAFKPERVGSRGKPSAGDRASLKSQDRSAGMNRCPKKKPAMNVFVRKPGDGMNTSRTMSMQLRCRGGGEGCRLGRQCRVKRKLNRICSTSIPPNARSSESTSEVEPGGTGVGSYTSTTTLDAAGTGEVVETFHFLPY